MKFDSFGNKKQFIKREIIVQNPTRKEEKFY